MKTENSKLKEEKGGGTNLEIVNIQIQSAGPSRIQQRKGQRGKRKTRCRFLRRAWLRASVKLPNQRHRGTLPKDWSFIALMQGALQPASMQIPPQPFTNSTTAFQTADLRP